MEDAIKWLSYSDSRNGKSRYGKPEVCGLKHHHPQRKRDRQRGGLGLVQKGSWQQASAWRAAGRKGDMERPGVSRGSSLCVPGLLGRKTWLPGNPDLKN